MTYTLITPVNTESELEIIGFDIELMMRSKT